MNYKKYSCALFLLLHFSLYAKVTIIHNIVGHSMDQYELITFEAIAFEYGKVLNTGRLKTLSKDYPKALLMDGQGQFMLPGMHDSSVDLMQSVNRKHWIDLSGLVTIEALLKKLQDFIDNNPEKQWIVGYGWNSSFWNPKNYPSHVDLDKLKTDKPIWIKSQSQNIGLANSKAMTMCKAAKYKNNPPMGTIAFKSNGDHAGIYTGNALNIIQPHVFRLKPLDIHKSLIQEINQLAHYGITSIDDMGASIRTVNTYKAIAMGNNSKIRINTSLSASEKDLVAMMKTGTYHEENQMMHFHGVHYKLDGDIDSISSAMMTPYLRQNNVPDNLFYPINYIKNKVSNYAKSNWQVTIEANGDRASRIALHSFSKQQAHTQELRHRIEFASAIDRNDFEKFKGSNVIITIHPNFALSQRNIFKRRLTEAQLIHTNPWKRLLDNDARLIIGSNYPLAPAYPFFNIHAAVTRGYRGTKNKTKWNYNQHLTVKQAFASYTIHPAYANRQEDSLGSLEPGKWADFILVDRNLFTVNQNDIWRIKVLQTWVAGKKIYQKTD